MGDFNRDDYEPVEERIKRFYTAYPDGRIVTENLTVPSDRIDSTWVVRAVVFLTADEQYLTLPKATGLAFEIDGQGMTQKTAALETCETSAIGRALANMNMSGNKRASREEMDKVGRADAHAINQVKVKIVRHMQGLTPEKIREAITAATGLAPDDYTVAALEEYLAKLEAGADEAKGAVDDAA